MKGFKDLVDSSTCDMVNWPNGNKKMNYRKNGPHAAFYMTNGDRYIGSWKDNMKHGGTYYYHSTESIYQGMGV
jgi:hypothetical protein